MNTKKISTIIIVVLLAITTIKAQETENYKLKSNHLGLHAGFTTGLGLSFRHWSNKYGVQITTIPIKTSDTKFISIGLTGLFSIKNEKYYRHFLYLGNHLIISQEEYLDDINGTYIEDDDNIYNLGFGYGFEVGRKVRFNIMVGYAGYNLLESDYSLLPTAEIGLYFDL